MEENIKSDVLQSMGIVFEKSKNCNPMKMPEFGGHFETLYARGILQQQGAYPTAGLPSSCKSIMFNNMVLPGSKNTVKMGIGVQQNREQEYSKNGNKNTVISINIINQGLHCIINKKQDCDGLKNKITYHYVSRDSQAS